MSVRLSCHDWTEGGNTPDDALIFARLFQAMVVDIHRQDVGDNPTASHRLDQAMLPEVPQRHLGTRQHHQQGGRALGKTISPGIHEIPPCAQESRMTVRFMPA